jgi:hypothetical protein
MAIDILPCDKCKNAKVELCEEPCHSCYPNGTHWEPVAAKVDTRADEKSCDNCKHEKLSVFKNPCRTCGESHPNWEPKPKKKSKWHLIGDKKPKDTDPPVIVGDKDGDSTTGFYIESKDKFYYIANPTLEINGAMCWRYMPKPPNEYRK